MQKYLFIDRDGTLVYEPHDYQVDALDKIKLLPNVIPSLLKLKDKGYTFIMVSNQDGLGTSSFPLETFTLAHEFILNLFKSQGITFEQVLICPHHPHDNCECRKPKLGLVTGYLNDNSWDKEHSYFIGDRDSDLQMAKNMGIKGIRVGDSTANNDSNISSSESEFAHIKAQSWEQIVDSILKNDMRCAHVERKTKETSIIIDVNLDDGDNHQGSDISTGIGFFDHMLDQIATHAHFKLKAQVKGDLHIDSHHTIEDTALALGSALKLALKDKKGIGRFGFVLPMDEVLCKISYSDNPTSKDKATLCTLNQQEQSTLIEAQGEDSSISVALDISARPHVEFDFHADFTREAINGFETQMVSHFFESLAVAMGLSLHMSVTKGNAHHQVEALFKGFGRALRPALKVVSNTLPSSKGAL